MLGVWVSGTTDNQLQLGNIFRCYFQCGFTEFVRSKTKFTNVLVPMTKSSTIAFLVVLHQRYLQIAFKLVLRGHSINELSKRSTRTIQSCANRISRFVNQHTGIITELDKASIRSLNLFACTNDNSMSNISATNFIGDTAIGRIFGTKVSLFLDDNNYPIACGISD